MVSGLWESLVRCAPDHWGQRADVIPGDEGYLIRVYMKGSIPVGMWSTVSSFMRRYIRDSGWQTKDFSRKKDFVEFKAQPWKPKPKKPKPEWLRQRQAEKSAKLRGGL